MTQHDDNLRLRHMLDHAHEAISMASGKQMQDIKQHRMLELALVKLIEIVGEAANRVSPEGQKEYPSIPWPSYYWDAESAYTRI